MNERDAYRARLAYMEQVRAMAVEIRDEYDDAIETRYHNAFMARVREREERERALERKSQVDALFREICDLVSYEPVMNVDRMESAQSEDMITSEHSPTTEEDGTLTSQPCTEKVRSLTQIQAPAPAELMRDSPSSSNIGTVAKMCTRMTPIFFTSVNDFQLWIIRSLR